MYDFGLTDEQFWELTPPKFAALSRRVEQTTKQQDLRFGMVCSVVANANGGKKGGGHFTAMDFVPKYGDEEEEQPKDGAQSPDDILAYLKAAFPPREVKEDSGG